MTKWFLVFFSILFSVTNLVQCAALQRTRSNEAGPTNVGESEASSEDNDPDETDTPGTEARDETPEDLGDIRVSETRTKEEIEADRLARRTFPLVYNEFVGQWINYFSGPRGRGFFGRWLERSTRYIPMIKQVLKEEGLPEDLIYLSMIESGFNPKAKSRAKAMGPWQFMKATGQRYNLEVDYFVDERKDITKSTRAAAQYLKELHQIFGSWYLAAAAYNAGEGKVLMAIRRDRSRNFWELSRRKKNFRAETRNYVPKIIAAALIAKNPERYGFTQLNYELPLRWETVLVPPGVQLKNVGEILDVDLEELRILNAELRRDLTPPGSDFPLRVPPEKAAQLKASLDQLKTQKVGRIMVHTVRRGETLSAIARRYDVSMQDIMEFNQIRSAKRLRIGMELEIPTEQERVVRSQASRQSTRRTEPASRPDDGENRYRVRSGDNLWRIAQRSGVSVEQLQRLNNLNSRSKLQPGQTLRLR